jgi:hypothetical protein
VPGPFVKVTAAGTPATIAEAKWEERAEELSFDALKSVRGIAEKWTGAVATLLAIFSIVALVKGPEDITKVEGSHLGISLETWVVIFIAIAVGCGAAATILAALAAYGLPQNFRFVGSEVRRLQRTEARKGATRLGRARYLAVAAVVALGIAIVVTWLNAKEEPAAPAKTLILDSNGIRACGTLQKSAETGRLEVLEKGKKNATAVPVEEVTAVGAIAACPGD